MWGAILAAVWLIPSLNFALGSFNNAGNLGAVVAVFQVLGLIQPPLIAFAATFVGAGLVIDYFERRPRDPISEPLRMLPDRR